MEIYFVRHAQTYGNKTGDYATSYMGDLTNKGKEQAEKLAERLEVYDFDKILVSPVKRARKTIIPYLKKSGEKAEIWSWMAEACWQDEVEEAAACWRSGRKIELADEEKDLFRLISEAELDRWPGPDETYGEGLKRIFMTYERIMDLYSDDNIKLLVLSHGHFGARLMEAFLKIETRGRFSFANTGISKLTLISDDIFNVSYSNRVS